MHSCTTLSLDAVVTVLVLLIAFGVIMFTVVVALWILWVMSPKAREGSRLVSRQYDYNAGSGNRVHSAGRTVDSGVPSPKTN